MANPTFADLAAEYYAEKYVEMKKIFQNSGLVMDIFREVGKYFSDDAYGYFSFYPFVRKLYLHKIYESNRNSLTSGSQIFNIYLPGTQIICESQKNAKVGWGTVHLGLLIAGYKDYIIVYPYPTAIHGSISFIEFEYKITCSLVYNYKDISPKDLVIYVQTKADIDIISMWEDYFPDCKEEINTMIKTLEEYYKENFL
jgi:hypothetical protein